MPQMLTPVYIYLSHACSIYHLYQSLAGGYRTIRHPGPARQASRKPPPGSAGEWPGVCRMSSSMAPSLIYHHRSSGVYIKS